jgi:hypothetical protein
LRSHAAIRLARRSHVLTDENRVDLVLLTNRGMRQAYCGLEEGLDVIEAEVKDTLPLDHRVQRDGCADAGEGHDHLQNAA